MLTPKEALELVASKAKFRAFTREDWYGYGGCETAHPLIADNEELGVWIVILDGDTVYIQKPDDPDDGYVWRVRELLLAATSEPTYVDLCK